MHAYPNDLAGLLRRRWNRPSPVEDYWGIPPCEGGDPLPPARVLEVLLSTCYHASLLREEDRPVRFRLILREPHRIGRSRRGPQASQTLEFDTPIPFEENELRRLAPAAAFERAMIGVRLRRGRLEIWGVIHSGTNWLQALEGSRRSYVPLPPALVVSVWGPGHLGVGKGSVTVAGLLAGRVTTPAPGTFSTAETSGDEDDGQEELLTAHERAQRRAVEPWAELDRRFVRALRQRMAMRLISAVRRAQHGGTVIFLPRPLARQPSQLQRYIRLKYQFLTSQSGQRFYVHMLRLLRGLAESEGRRSGPSSVVGWKEYVASTASGVVEADDAMAEITQLVAGMACVDGAVVLARPAELIGFGGEISGQLPSVDYVARALDTTGRHIEMESTAGVGTRHRSVYRLCQALPQCAGFVVSQDGGVRVVRHFNGRVTYWEQLSLGMLGL